MLDSTNVAAAVPLDNVADDTANFGNPASPPQEHGR